MKETMLDTLLQMEFEYYRERHHKARFLLVHPEVRAQMFAFLPHGTMRPKSIHKMEPETVLNMAIVVVSPDSYPKTFMEAVG